MVINAPLEDQRKTTIDPIVNDFAFTVATQNGSGSQTSNNVLVKTLFDMGIPVNGKNLFPSNIKGLPTWYTIRASKFGYTARRYQTEIVVAYNQDTATEDISKLPANGVCILPADWKWTHSREDIVYYEVPIKEIMAKTDINPDFRKRVENMTYVGVMAQLYNLPLDMIYSALLANFGGKAKAADMNMQVIRLAYEYFEQNVQKADPYRFEPMDGTKGKILITGNEAGALGALFGGVGVVAWYPITPSTSLVDGILAFKDIRRDPVSGKETVAVVQAEDELAAVGMIIGAGWSGARSMTATSGPGISLMSEFTGLAYYAEIPCVIWDITRMGPSTGLPTRTSQGDILFIHFLGHGDTRQIVLLPANPEEAFEFGWKSFDIADQMQTPVFVASDLDLGMNNWMSETFAYPDKPINKGKVLDEATLQSFIDKNGKWGRYMDVDGDGVGYRTIPGTDHPMAAYFARGTGHNQMATYSERSDDWVANMTRLRHKMATARAMLEKECAPIVDHTDGKKVAIITFGTNEPAIIEARDMLAQRGVETNYLRVRALPMPHAVTEFITEHERVYVIENNFDGQLHQIISLEHQQDIRHVKSLALGDGLPMTAHWIVDKVMVEENQ